MGRPVAAGLEGRDVIRRATARTYRRHPCRSRESPHRPLNAATGPPYSSDGAALPTRPHLEVTMPDTDGARMRVESFNLDHRTVAAPYIRLADRKHLASGGTISKYDLRFTQPNVDHLDTEALHSVEHLFAEHSRAHSDAVIDFSPMGCRTGFYLILDGAPANADVFALVEQTMTDILAADEVPAANEVQCGWGAHHSLDGAKRAVQAFVDGRSGWAQVEQTA
jgi:S-ribosylhomocysteine lyase